MKLNNKGFTLVEVLAVLLIISLLVSMAVPSVINSINVSKKTSYKVLVSNIVTGSIQLYEEVLYGDEILSGYSIDEDNKITITLQDLVNNGFLVGSNDKEKTSKVIINPKTNEPIGYCSITIKRDNINAKVTYTVISNGGEGCPTSDDYKNGVK